jgi:hypothetical protein
METLDYLLQVLETEQKNGRGEENITVSYLIKLIKKAESIEEFDGNGPDIGDYTF